MDLFPYGIILHFCISFVRGAVKAGQWGEAGFPGELLAAPFQPSRSTDPALTNRQVAPRRVRPASDPCRSGRR
jgi:hypothetical protein